MSKQWTGESAENRVMLHFDKLEAAEYSDAVLLSQNPAEYIRLKLQKIENGENTTVEALNELYLEIEIDLHVIRDILKLANVENRVQALIENGLIKNVSWRILFNLLNDAGYGYEELNEFVTSQHDGKYRTELYLRGVRNVLNTVYGIKYHPDDIELERDAYAFYANPVQHLRELKKRYVGEEVVLEVFYRIYSYEGYMEGNEVFVGNPSLKIFLENDPFSNKALKAFFRLLKEAGYTKDEVVEWIEIGSDGSEDGKRYEEGMKFILNLTYEDK